MNWFAAILTGAVAAWLYCASLRAAIDRAIRSAHPVVWIGATSAARLGLIGGVFFALTMLGAEAAVWGLVGFAAARSGITYWVGRPR